MARFASLLLVAAALPFAFATSSGGQCSDMEFYYSDKDCCLPYGGQQNPPTPPQGSQQCPTSGWEWHSGKECCVPQQPPENNPPPQCSGEWEWDKGSSTCCQGSHTSSAPAPTPSAKSTKSGGHGKRHMKSRAISVCPDNMEVCPINGLTGPSGDVECLDTTAELSSCGGCASTGAGQDCSAIEGVWNVGCEQGVCAIYTCAQGYKRSTDGQSCIKL